MTREIEIPFRWHCPKCSHAQTDTVNPVLGPFVTLTCGECGSVSSEKELAQLDAARWDKAIEEAEHAEAS